MSTLELSAIVRYPLKSARGQALHEAAMDRQGLTHDRRWMLVDDRGRFVSQRRLPRLALLEALPTDQGLRLGFHDAVIETAIPNPAGECVIAQIWDDSVVAPLAETAVNDWLSERLGEALRLVHFPATALRGIEAGYGPSSQLVAFADGYPLLIVTEESLTELNGRLPVPVLMDRFRPNLVIRGAYPHAEDNWRRIRIGGSEIELVKPCSRCAIPGINQQTGAVDPHVNRALAAYRRRGGIVYFGMNAVAPPGARFRVGDAVELMDPGP